MRFKDKVVLLTGGSSGIGQATCLDFAREGAKVAFVGRDAERVASTAAMLDEIGAEHLEFIGDVSKASDVETAVDGTVNRFGRIDILVNNAGMICPGGVVDLTEEDVDRMMGVNFKGVFLFCKHVIPLMQKQGGGKIINVSSMAALRGLRQRAGYCASKAAVSLMTKSMALDHAADNININSVCPGSVETGLTRMTFADPVLRAEKSKNIPWGRFAKPNEISPAILFLASDEAVYLTGTEIYVDGGLTAQ